MEIIIVIIIVAVVSLLSAANKKKTHRDPDEPQQPTMSEIQKAFMLSSEFDDRERRAQRQTAQTATPYTAPQAARKPQPQAAHVPMSPRVAANPYTGVTINRYHMDEPEDADTLTVNRRTADGGLKLFAEKDAFVRAVIYSEILTRKGSRRSR